MYRSLIALLLIVGITTSSVGQQKSLSVTIYNDDFAMIKDVRSMTFDQGSSFLYFTDVSLNIETQTVTFKPLNKDGKVSVFEQNFEKNLINKNSILNKYIEKNVELYVTLGESSKRVTGKLLGYNDGYIIQTTFGISVFNKIDAITFQSLPDGFFTLPTLNWKVFSQKSIKTDCQVAYRTTGFSWKSDYSITLNSDETKADIGGWVTIDNNSGKKYVNAKLKLIAGDVQKVTSAKVMPMMAFARNQMMMADSSPTFSEKSFADYHLYTLSAPVTLNESSQKQVQFIPKVYNITIRKYHVVNINAGGYTQNNLKATNKVQFKNSKSNGLGIPFPKGTVRVFKQDQADKSLQFVGQDSINHIPKDQNITITTGNAFDITINKYAESRRGFDKGGYSAANNITISNRKEVNVEVQVQINTYYGDNLKITWNTPGVQLVKDNVNLYKFTKVLKPDETFVAKWKQDYFP